MRTFDNVNQLKRSVIERRIQSLDAAAAAATRSAERIDGSLCHYVDVSSSLTDAQIEACLGPLVAADTQAETAERERQEFLSLIVSKWQNEFIPLRNWARTKGYPG